MTPTTQTGAPVQGRTLFGADRHDAVFTHIVAGTVVAAIVAGVAAPVPWI